MFRWNEENQQAQQAVLTRPAVTASKEVEAICIDILNAVKTEGDAALLKMAKEFDKRETPRLLVPVEEINQAEQLLSNELKAAIETAYANVKRFHQAQLPKRH